MLDPNPSEALSDSLGVFFATWKVTSYEGLVVFTSTEVMVNALSSEDDAAGSIPCSPGLSQHPHQKVGLHF
jgi:hypothetical protein